MISNNRLMVLAAGISSLALASTAQAQGMPDAPVETAETQTDATAQLEFLKAQLEGLQAQINDLQKKSDKNEASWKSASWVNETKISGRMYFNFSNIAQKSNGAIVPSTDKTTNFELKRFYLGVDHKFDNIFSANLTTDVTWTQNPPSKYDADPSKNSNSNVGASLYIKKAYLQAKLDDALTIRLGASDTPWIPFVEGLYGYRHIEQTIADRTKFGTSSDWGIHASGKFGGGVVEYAVAAINGAGYRVVPGVGGNNRSRTLDVEGRVNVNYNGFVAGVGGYSGKLGKDVKPSAIDASPAVNTAQRFNAVLAYKSDLFTIGGEYFTAKNWSNVTASKAYDVKSDGWSAFGSVNFMPKWSVFGRYDHVRTDKFADIKDDYFNVGIQYSPAKIVDLALVYKRDTADNGAVSTTNGTIGASGLGSRGTYDEFGLFGQFRF